MLTFLFWTSLFLIIYGYFLYPLVMLFWSRFFKPPQKNYTSRPFISIIMSVWNEETTIEQKIQNLRSLDYPQDKYEILIGSDGSKDQTNAIITPYTSPLIKTFPFPIRRGKPSVINELVPNAHGEIIVFCDARQRFDSDVLREFAANFSDPCIGCVSGELLLEPHAENSSAHGIGLYWQYEKFIRAQESRVHSMLGATGAIYAIRKSLFTPVPEDLVLDDMFIPFTIIQKGYRAIFDTDAKAFDKLASNIQEENRRKIRTLFGNYQIFSLFRSMFIPSKSPIAFQFFSHKFLRCVIPFLLILMLICNLFLVGSAIYTIFLFLQIFFYVMAWTGSLANNIKYDIFKPPLKLCKIAHTFCMLNLAALIGFWRYITRRQNVTWEKAKG